MHEAGAELDRKVMQTLFDDCLDEIPEFSTRDSAADYLLRFLKRSGIAWRIRLADATWDCELSTRSGKISSGRAKSRSLAISRAVVHADIVPGRRRSAAAPSGSDTGCDPRRRIVRDCAACGAALKSARSASRGVRYCNLCEWKQIRISTRHQAS